jgi:hypothetical protein
MAKRNQPVQGPASAELACGCVVGFRAGVEGSPVSVMVERKSGACRMPLHVAGLAIHDHREAIRPSTRLAPPVHSDYEES